MLPTPRRCGIALVAIEMLVAGAAHAEGGRLGDIRGWSVTGPGDNAPDFKLTDYEGGLDRRCRHGGAAGAFLRSKVDKPGKHAVVMQSIRSDRYRGKRVRLSAWVKTEGVAEEAALWMRVVPADRDRTFARGAAPARGTTDWTRYQVVLDVAPESQSIMFGLSPRGIGKAWIDDVTWEVVDASVPVTASTSEPLEPSNLAFEE